MYDDVFEIVNHLHNLGLMWPGPFDCLVSARAQVLYSAERKLVKVVVAFIQVSVSMRSDRAAEWKWVKMECINVARVGSEIIVAMI